jgi:hypothetical protein
MNGYVFDIGGHTCSVNFGKPIACKSPRLIAWKSSSETAGTTYVLGPTLNPVQALQADIRDQIALRPYGQVGGLVRMIVAGQTNLVGLWVLRCRGAGWDDHAQVAAKGQSGRHNHDGAALVDLRVDVAAEVANEQCTRVRVKPEPGVLSIAHNLLSLSSCKSR